jgi:phosphate transport system substrate-binding protein
MIKRALLSLTAGVLLSGAALTSQAADITGAGATFPYPIFAKWAEVYKKIENVGLNYQSLGRLAPNSCQDRNLRCFGCACSRCSTR